MAKAVPNSFKVMLWKGQITGLTDAFKIILLEPGFVFDKDVHHSYADISAYELSTGNGYVAGGKALTNVAIVVNNTTNRAETTWDNAQWNASGGSLVASGAAIYNDDTDTAGGDDYTDAIVSYKDANGDMTATDGTPIIVSALMETIEDASAT